MRQFGLLHVAPLGHLSALAWGISPRPKAFAAAVAFLGSMAFERDLDFGLKEFGSASSSIFTQLREFFLVSQFGNRDRERDRDLEPGLGILY